MRSCSIKSFCSVSFAIRKLRRFVSDPELTLSLLDELCSTVSPRTLAPAFAVAAAAFSSGGGVNGQADAVKLGIARALMLFNIELRKKLKSEGMVSRDSRSKERKKYGQKGARKRFQYSKR